MKKIFSIAILIITSATYCIAQDVISDKAIGTDGKRVIKTQHVDFKSNQWMTSTDWFVQYDPAQDEIEATLYVTANTHDKSKPVAGTGKYITISTDKGTVLDSVACDVVNQDTKFYSMLMRDFTTCCFVIHPNYEQLKVITTEGIYCIRSTDTSGSTPFDIIPKKGKLTKLVQNGWANITSRLHGSPAKSSAMPVPNGSAKEEEASSGPEYD